MENNNLDDNEIEIEEEYEYGQEEVNKIKNENKKEMNNEENPNKLCLIALILFFSPSLITPIAYSLFDNKLVILQRLFLLCARVCPMLAVVMIIYVSIKYPQNKFIKILSVIIGICIVIYIVFMVYIVYMCNSSCDDCLECIRAME